MSQTWADRCSPENSRATANISGYNSAHSMVRAFVDRLLEKAEKILDPDIAARARVALGSPEYFNGFSGPMNGQIARLEAIRQIIYRCGIRQIVETGTYHGTTTEWMASFGLPVVTIESNVHNYHFSRLRLRHLHNVEVKFGSSVDVLSSVLDKLDCTAPTLFYLDAHWEIYLPLRDELRTILPRMRAAVLVIDDFQVPDESGYAFDDYGAGKALTMEYLDASLSEEAAVYYPSTPALQETGHRRGWAVVTANPEMAAVVDSIALVRSATAKRASTSSEWRLVGVAP